MKRNWDVVRKILIKVEELPDADSQLDSTEIEGIDKQDAAHHMRLLLDARLMVGGCRQSTGAPWCYAERLTWEGHEFLDKVRNETVWNKIKSTARVKGLDLSIDVIKKLATVLIDGLLG